MLDKVAPYIYKYVPIDGGFSTYKEYLTAETAESLSSPNSIAIDGSIYVNNTSRLVRFISGAKDSFSLKSPDEYVINAFAISPESDTIAILDKDRERILLFSKSGEFLKQIVSSEIKRATSLLLDSNGKLLLQGEKGLYRLSE
ncbi:MAG: hypothetical protein UZ21_OP11001000828 [Microgenomates bacterium OLB22]|nr:MAG: hypothetical protein UZ21_OP11001000828 [Microgenomates bacterium OLB22]